MSVQSSTELPAAGEKREAAGIIKRLVFFRHVTRA